MTRYEKEFWYADSGEVLLFGRVLAASHDWGVTEVFDYFEKPYKWNEEHEKWETLKRPEVLP